MRVLVTGASGYLGGATIDALLADGCQVRALVRESSDTRALRRRQAQGQALELAYASLLPDSDTACDALRDALTGVDAIAHLAGGGRVRSPRDFVVNNAETTRSLCTALEQVREAHGASGAPRRVVFVSSLAARGPASSPAPETSPQNPLDAQADAPITAYGRAKLQAEQRVRGLVDTQVVILRPPGIYGPGDERLLPLFKAAKRGWMPLPAAGETVSFVYIDDCASAISRALTSPWVSAAPYYLEDGEVHGTSALARGIAAAVGTSPRIFRVPLPMLHTAAFVSEGVARLRGAQLLLTRDKVRDLAQAHWTCDATAFRADYDWQPTVAIAEGLQRTAADYRARGWI